MVLPLPKVVADVGPGGPVVTAMQGMNALTQSDLENQIKSIEAKYAPISKLAQASSQLAYANLLGPQFLSKLMGNQHILAALPPGQRRQALDMVYRAGSGQGTGNALINNLAGQPESQPTNPLGRFVNYVRDAFGFGSQPQATNPLPNLSPQDQNAINNMQPGQSYVVQGNNPDRGMAYDAQGNNVVASPQEIANAGGTESPDVYPKQVGRYKTIVSQEEEAGKLRAKQIDELDDIVFRGETLQTTLDEAANIVSSPKFQEIKKFPIAGKYELSYYKINGTPQQKKMIGQYETLLGKFIADSASEFKGSFRAGEQDLLEKMKPSESDTVESAQGKIESLSYLNKMMIKRAEITSDLMDRNSIGKSKAMRLADKQINGEEIRQKIKDQLSAANKVNDKRIPVRDKNGTLGSIPASQWEEAKKQGFKKA